MKIIIGSDNNVSEFIPIRQILPEHRDNNLLCANPNRIPEHLL
jgi:hypothetical protein